MNTQTKPIRQGDRVLYHGTTAQVLRVTDSRAVLAVPQPKRTIRTRFGKVVRFTVAPAIVSLAPESELPVLNR